MVMFVIAMCVLSVTLVSGVQAQPYTFTAPLDVPGPTGRQLGLLKLTAAPHTLLGEESAAGGIAARINPDRTIVPILCPSFPPRSSVATRGGPQVFDMNSHQWVAFQDELPGAVYAGIHKPDGTCEHFLPTGALGALATSITDPDPVTGEVTVKGQYWIDAPGLPRFKAFKRVGTVITDLPAPYPNSVRVPTSTSQNGQYEVGHLFKDIDLTTNAYTWQAYVETGGVLTEVDYTTGEELSFLHVNNTGKVLFMVGQEGGAGGAIGLYDIPTGTFTTLPKPSTATGVIVRGLNHNGDFLGAYFVHVGNPELGQQEVHGFLAVNDAPPSPPAPPLKKQKGKPRKSRHSALTRQVYDDLCARHGMLAARQGIPDLPMPLAYEPVVEEDGTVTLANGKHTLGQHH
jgi:hypothetical protein